MPLVLRPSSDNPIYIEWKKWADLCDQSFSNERCEAKKSIERIAEFIYEDRTVTGYMIMKRDQEQMDAEDTPTDPTPSKGDK